MGLSNTTLPSIRTVTASPSPDWPKGGRRLANAALARAGDRAGVPGKRPTSEEREETPAVRALGGVNDAEAAYRPMSDADVILASRREPDRFALIFARHVDAVYGYLCRRVGQRFAEDLTAETFAT